MTFNDWLKDHQQELLDFYCEGVMVNKDMLTMIEDFARKAFKAGSEQGYNECFEEYKHRF